MTDEEEEYKRLLTNVACEDVLQLVEARKSYGDSWKNRGGSGAFMMLARKWDRLENQVKKVNYDIFDAYAQDTRDEGILDDIQDLRRYLILVESEIIRLFKSGIVVENCKFESDKHWEVLNEGSLIKKAKDKLFAKGGVVESTQPSAEEGFVAVDPGLVYSGDMPTAMVSAYDKKGTPITIEIDFHKQTVKTDKNTVEMHRSDDNVGAPIVTRNGEPLGHPDNIHLDNTGQERPYGFDEEDI